MFSKDGGGWSVKEVFRNFLRKEKEPETITSQPCPHAHVISVSDYSTNRTGKCDIFLRKHVISLKIIKICK